MRNARKSLDPEASPKMIHTDYMISNLIIVCLHLIDPRRMVLQKGPRAEWKKVLLQSSRSLDSIVGRMCWWSVVSSQRSRSYLIKQLRTNGDLEGHSYDSERKWSIIRNPQKIKRNSTSFGLKKGLFSFFMDYINMHAVQIGKETYSLQTWRNYKEIKPQKLMLKDSNATQFSCRKKEEIVYFRPQMVQLNWQEMVAKSERPTNFAKIPKKEKSTSRRNGRSWFCKTTTRTRWLWSHTRLLVNFCFFLDRISLSRKKENQVCQGSYQGHGSFSPSSL